MVLLSIFFLNYEASVNDGVGGTMIILGLFCVLMASYLLHKQSRSNQISDNNIHNDNDNDNNSDNNDHDHDHPFRSSLIPQNPNPSSPSNDANFNSSLNNHTPNSNQNGRSFQSSKVSPDQEILLLPVNLDENDDEN